jgi:PmbA protein
VVVEKGVFKTFLHNRETAEALGQENTGHGARNYRGVLGVAPSNLYLEPLGNLAFTEGVLITEFMGLHAGANPVSLDFSLQALGLWVEEGEVRYAVENFAVSGNLLELLQGIEGVGSDWTGSSGVRPSGAPPWRWRSFPSRGRKRTPRG